ncbi:4'-phosphopantetheinyl transferase superfamily protein [Saccharopolyspora antimicrobica]|uniref:4'-phosphopantetheinyl transferase superfamily protein n=1 Tax=Saccharopolyspora antimicrobica TaxID=455193 RepID=A0A1I5C7D3_9PSEU|nr:4'-phosphopantetheinyl transferase superfamily protein [Saccharopolyspora antimicrobica]RKT88950.1 4'-phosphopantetheinyl transferase superfamily protein [Saccharopolyspora antimicrobica]SFN82766.1 4'-phosphopantetheinyl transferase superfamily protein [Saccharopolyspora antimicrobica]
MSVELEVPAAAGAVVEWRQVRPPRGPREQSAAGRRAASAALAAAGSADRAVPRAPDGRPRFPSGFPGSISHTESVAVAVVVPGAASVGVDVESADIGPRVTAFVLRARERRMLLPPAGEYTPRELFAAKEAAFKAMSGLGVAGEFLFWQAELSPAGGELIASYRDAQVRVQVRSSAELSFALAIRW